MRIGMIPAPTEDEWEKKANPHLSILTTELAKRGWEIVSLDNAQVTHPRQLESAGLDIIWIHWPSALFDVQEFSYSGRLANLTRLLRNKAELAGSRISKNIFQVMLWMAQRLHEDYVNICAPHKIKLAVKALEICHTPVVWELHDLASHHVVHEKKLAHFDRRLHQELFRICAAIVVHEQSCLVPVFKEFGAKRPYVVAELGPYYYGPPLEKNVARRRLGMETSGKIFAYLGTARPNRNPRASIISFTKVAGADDRLILAGIGLHTFLPESHDPRIAIFDRFLAPDEYRDVICAADFVINDGEQYLTSAVIRTAMSYEIPVIVQPFGAGLDMAHGAALFIGAEGIEGALLEALEMDRDKYQLLCSEARKRSDERSWEESGRKLDDFFRCCCYKEELSTDVLCNTNH